MPKNDQSHLADISRKLDQLIFLTAASVVKGMKQTPAIVALGAMGLDRNVIASVVGTTPGTVSVRLSEAKGAKAKKVTPDKKTATTTAVTPVSAESDTQAIKR